MFAFSQIIASGNKVSQVTDAMDKEIETHPEQKDEDNTMLAYSYSMPGNDGEEKPEVVDPKAAEAESNAQKELDKLNTDDNTSAFVGLLQAEEMQQKMEKAAIKNTSGDDESIQIEEDFKKASGDKKGKKANPPKPQAKKSLAQTSSKKSVEKDDAPTPDSDTLLTLSTSVA